MAVSDDDKCLFVVNPGSDTVSSFKIYHEKLEFVGEYYTDGSFPISVTHYDRFVYVLNAGDEGSISGYRVNTNNCRLRPMDRSTRSLNIVDGESPPNFLVAPSQISFTPDGKSLIVVIKGADIPGNFPNLQGDGKEARTFKVMDMADLASKSDELGRIIVAWCDMKDAR